MNEEPTRRDVLGYGARGAGLLVLGSTAFYLTKKAHAKGVWVIDPAKCINIRLGTTGIDQFCDKCATTCVIPLSAVRAVNDFSKCGRCCICPAYFDVASDIGRDGLPVRKLCPRDAITREAIGDVDPDDPLNNFYEYTIDKTKCNGCGKCVMACKEPAGLGSIRLEIRYDLCTDCNRCAISTACPEDALARITRDLAPGGKAVESSH
ncbi:MAG: 4Fe-4S binding protein [Phycisphaerales bacterium]|nr:MAG: 4Fe-4S binding protein [Phycisphaerales bacterium]